MGGSYLTQASPNYLICMRCHRWNLRSLVVAFRQVMHCHSWNLSSLVVAFTQVCFCCSCCYVSRSYKAPWWASWWRQVCLWMYSGREPPSLYHL